MADWFQLVSFARRVAFAGRDVLEEKRALSGAGSEVAFSYAEIRAVVGDPAPDCARSGAFGASASGVESCQFGVLASKTLRSTWDLGPTVSSPPKAARGACGVARAHAVTIGFPRLSRMPFLLRLARAPVLFCACPFTLFGRDRQSGWQSVHCRVTMSSPPFIRLSAHAVRLW